MEHAIVSNWKGSVNTADLVRKQIAARWGEAEAANYDPQRNCLTFNRWLDNGYHVKKGETALKSFILIERKDKDHKVLERRFKPIHLFYIRQVEKAA